MPVYNRPAGLRRALTCLTRQTYPNIEIIVSDNCSPGAQVKAVVDEFMQHDSRVHYFRQDTSLGIHGNFQFVLRQANGDYFMWAADDDEWDASFIEQCMLHLKQPGVVSVMSGFSTLFRHNGQIVRGTMPALASNLGAAGNILAFLDRMTPSLFYGLHKRRNIAFFLEESFFDFYDCYFVVRLMLQGEFRIIDSPLYIAGVDAPNYLVKPARKYLFTTLKYSPLFFHSTKYVVSSHLPASDKVKIVMKLIRVVIALFLFHEVKRVFQRV